MNDAVLLVFLRSGMLLRVVDLGRMAYADAYRFQCQCVEEVLAARRAGSPRPGFLLLVEHDPVITVTPRALTAGHILATPDRLAALGIELARTDRGGDVTYHGPGQIVAYLILDLNLLGLGLHAYMRLLEDAVIAVCSTLDLPARRESGATGVWIERPDGSVAKICAMGVRVRQWVSMHGLALNVTTNLEHFSLIVPCGLAGRPVTSVRYERSLRGQPCPPIEDVRRRLADALQVRIGAALEAASATRGPAAQSASSSPAPR